MLWGVFGRGGWVDGRWEGGACWGLRRMRCVLYYVNDVWEDLCELFVVLIFNSCFFKALEFVWHLTTYIHRWLRLRRTIMGRVLTGGGSRFGLRALPLLFSRCVRKDSSPGSTLYILRILFIRGRYDMRSSEQKCPQPVSSWCASHVNPTVRFPMSSGRNLWGLCSCSLYIVYVISSSR